MSAFMTLRHGQEAAAPAHTLGSVDSRGRYPVTVGGQLSGFVSRWHGTWRAVTVDGLVLPDRHPGRDTAARQLALLTAPGTPTPVPQSTTQTPERLTAHAHLLDPGLSATPPRNVVGAAVALARLDELAWLPLAGYPGADNRWLLRCLICAETHPLPWEGPRFWSHLRGRNGDRTPRPLCRHQDCLPVAEHADRIARFAVTPETECPCPEHHPTTSAEAKPLLTATGPAWRRRDQDALLELLARLLGPCPASRARATALQSLTAKPAHVAA